MEAFEKLEELLTSAPILTILNGTKPFNFYTDTCGKRLRAVLMQVGRAIA